jgi:hypothetical protein
MRMMPRSPSCSTWQEVHCVAFAWNCVDCFVPKSVPAWQVRQVRVSTPLPGVWQAVHWPAKDWWALERAGRYELRHQAGIPRRVRSHPDRDRGDHHQQGCDEDGVGKTLPAHSQRSL